LQDFSSANIEQLPALFLRLENLFLLDLDQAYIASGILLARCKQLKISAVMMARMYLIHSKMLWGKGQYHAAFYSVTQTLKKIRESSAFELKAEAYLWRGLCNLNLKRHVVSVEDFTYSVELALEYSQISIAIEAYVNISQIYYYAGQHEAAREILIIGYRLAVLLNDHKQITKSGIFLANNLNEAGEYTGALYLLHQIETSALLYGDMTWVVEAGKSIAISYAALGENELAELYFETMLAIALFNRAVWARSLTLVNYAEFLIKQQRHPEAIDCLIAAEQGINYFDYDYLQHQSTLLLVKAYKMTGEFEKALFEIKKYKNLSDVLFSNNVLSDLKGNGLNLSRLDRSRKKIIKTRQDFEHMLDLISPGESRSRYQQFQYRCANAPTDVRIIYMQFSGISAVKGQFLQKMSALLREFCLGESTWTKLPNLAYLIIPEHTFDAPEVIVAQLLEIINGFPWSWHALDAPLVDIQLISAEAAMDLLTPIQEGIEEIELFI
jgi:tetratricopeptide (TPR) repeat protein